MADHLGEIDWSWQHDAACQGEDPALFFPPNAWEKPSERWAREAEAKAICARCPVRAQCLAYALAAEEPAGVWGGLNEEQRRQLRRARGRHVA